MDMLYTDKTDDWDATSPGLASNGCWDELFAGCLPVFPIRVDHVLHIIKTTEAPAGTQEKERWHSEMLGGCLGSEAL